MPEGPEIRRAADKLEQAVAGKPLTYVWFAFPELKPFETALTGERVERLETRGKALLTHFSNGLTLYSHNQLYGVWRIVKPDTELNSTRQLRVRLATAGKAILLYSASPAPIKRKQRAYRYQILIKLLRTARLSRAIQTIYTFAGDHRGELYPMVEVNPQDML